MNQPQAYLNGQFLRASEVSISPVDTGFVLGATVAEQLRTFGGRLYRTQAHLSRLDDALRMIGIEPPVGLDELASIADRLVAENHRLLEPGDDLGLSIFVTPGPYAAYALSEEPPRPTICLHTYRLPFGLWAGKYRVGESLRTTSVCQVPSDCWPAGLKCRSRMHYYLADRLAAAKEPGARALLLDRAGMVTETSTANILIYTAAEGLISPPEGKILHGISMDTVSELTAELGIPTTRRDFGVEEVASADEVLLTSTPFCLLPVARFNGRSVGGGAPGEIFARLLRAWSERVGLDIAVQAERFAAGR